MDEPLKYFYLAGSDKIFQEAKAKIKGENTILVESDHVSEPLAVRYLWISKPDHPNFYNKAGFPASPFRSDDWDLLSKGKRTIHYSTRSTRQR